MLRIAGLTYISFSLGLLFPSIANGATTTTQEADPSSQTAPFRHRNLDYWDVDTFAAYLSVSVDAPHNPISAIVSGEGDVSEDSQQNYNHPIYAGNDAAVLLYAQWDQNCHALAPLWDQIANLIEAGTVKQNVVMALFDCEKNEEHISICQKVGVTKYPTMLYIGKGTYHDTDAITSTVLGKERSAGTFGVAPLPQTVKFQGDWRYGEQIMDWILMMKGLSSWQKWMEGHGGSEGGLLGMVARFLLRPFKKMKMRDNSSLKNDKQKTDEMLPVGIPPEVLMKQAVQRGSPSGKSSDSAVTANSGSSAASAAALSKASLEIEQLKEEKEKLSQGAEHASLIISTLLFPENVDVKSSSSPSDGEDDPDHATSAKDTDVFSVLSTTWQDYSRVGEILLSTEYTDEEKRTPLMQSCVIDLSLDYCTRFLNKKITDTYDMLSAEADVSSLSKEEREAILADIDARSEPYCDIIESCMTNNFDSVECRPETCPLENPMGCQYTNTCMDKSLLKEYEDAVKELLVDDNSSNKEQASAWGVA